MQALKADHDRNDNEAIALIAHNLVSTAGNLGARRLCLTARRLEQACRIGNSAEILRLVPLVQDAAQAASAGITGWLEREPLAARA